MSKILIVYGTAQGQTEKIAGFIAQQLVVHGHNVDLFDCNYIPYEVDVDEYDATIVGGSVHIGGFQHMLKAWVKNNAQALSNKPSAFFSVCLGVLQNASRLEEEQTVTRFFEATGWHPKTWTIFAGALSYSRYNWFLKRIMRRIAKKAGVDTDLSRDHEYTDWTQVKQFTSEFEKNQGFSHQ